MREIGTVVELDGEFAVAAIKRKSACGGNCASCSGCPSRNTTVRVKNITGAKKGDAVEIEMCEKNVLFAAFLVYILPLLIFAAGYYISHIFIENNIFCIIAAFIFMIIGFFLLHIYDKKNDEKYIPKAVSVVKDEK